MTLRSSYLQSDSDLDSIRNFCDVYYFIQVFFVMLSCQSYQKKTLCKCICILKTMQHRHIHSTQYKNTGQESGRKSILFKLKEHKREPRDQETQMTQSFDCAYSEPSEQASFLIFRSSSDSNWKKEIEKEEIEKEKIEKEENVKDCKNADWLDLLSLRRSLVQTWAQIEISNEILNEI